MSSRDRVLAAISGCEPDRVPLDLGSTRVTGVAPGIYTRLRERLGIQGEPARVSDVWQMLAWVEHPVVKALGLDVLPVPRLIQDFGMRIDGWRTWQLDDGTPVRMPRDFAPVIEHDGSLCLYLDGELVARKVPASPYFDRVLDLRMLLPPPPVEEVLLPVLGDEELEWMRQWAEGLRAETDKAVAGEFGFNLGRWGSYQEWLYTIAADPDYVRAWYKRKIENLLVNVELYAQAVGSNVDIVWMMEDFGTQKGMMISPRTFDEMVAPYYRILFDWIHENTSWKIFFHSCGGIYSIIGKLIECGVDILNPVQTTAAGMDPARLKQEFGDRITFWGGGVDTQTVLPFGSREDVMRQVSERISIFGPGGRFVFAPVHNIQEDTPVDNVLAMFEAVHRYGEYPLEAGKP